jgi:hypothetical protein
MATLTSLCALDTKSNRVSSVLIVNHKSFGFSGANLFNDSLIIFNEIGYILINELQQTQNQVSFRISLLYSVSKAALFGIKF